MDLKPLVTLLAIVNPLAIIPFFIHYTQHFTEEQRRNTVRISSISTFVVIAVSALLGLHILNSSVFRWQAFKLEAACCF